MRRQPVWGFSFIDSKKGGGVARDRRHLTGRGHFRRPNMSWNKANNKKKTEKNICTVITPESTQDQTH